MTLHDLLDDLARDEPLELDAAAAWTTGRARRRSRLPRLLAAAAALLGVLALVVPAVPLPGGTVAAGPAQAQGYPQRLTQPLFVDELPARPGALAAVVLWPERTWARRLSWLLPEPETQAPPVLHAVSPTGEVWRVPGRLQHVTLSPDGRRMVGLREGDGALVVRDLVDGGELVVPGVAARTAQVAGAAQVPEDWPALWSPDSRQVAWSAGHALVVDVVAGTFVRVPPTGTVVGWRSASELVFLQRLTDGWDTVTTGLDGTERARVRLQGPVDADLPLQFGAQVTADGSALVLPEGKGRRWFDLATGRRGYGAADVLAGGSGCLPVAQVGGSPDLVLVVLPHAADGADAHRYGPEVGVDVPARIDPLGCPVFSAGALGGTPHVDEGLLPQLEAVAGVLGVGLVTWCLVRVLRRRRA